MLDKSFDETNTYKNTTKIRPTYGGFLKYGYTPSHPFLDGIFVYQPTIFWYPLCLEPPITENECTTWPP